MLYRIYIVTGPGCRTVPLDLDCTCDAAAMDHVSGMIRPDRSVKVWDRCRLVGEVGPVFAGLIPPQA